METESRSRNRKRYSDRQENFEREASVTFSHLFLDVVLQRLSVSVLIIRFKELKLEGTDFNIFARYAKKIFFHLVIFIVHIKTRYNVRSLRPQNTSVVILSASTMFVKV